MYKVKKETHTHIKQQQQKKQIHIQGKDTWRVYPILFCILEN